MSSVVIQKRSPTRVDLAGGTLDLWPISAFFAPVTTINVAISIWTHVKLTPLTSSAVQLDVRDLGLKCQFDNLESFLNDRRRELTLLQKIVGYFAPTSGLSLVTESESPVGGGLGGSSSLTVSLIRAFAEWQRQSLTVDQAVHLAHNLEAQVLGVPTGTQDYYPALVGGLNVIEYGLGQTQLRQLKFPAAMFDEQFLLVYTGRPHQSGLNNWKVLRETIDGDPRTLEALSDLKKVAWEVEGICRKENWEQLPAALNREFEARVRLSSVFTSPEIERLRTVAMGAGALAVKICGAGGGGCVMIWCPPQKRERVAEACLAAKFQVLEKARPVVIEAESPIAHFA